MVVFWVSVSSTRKSAFSHLAKYTPECPADVSRGVLASSMLTMRHRVRTLAGQQFIENQSRNDITFESGMILETFRSRTEEQQSRSIRPLPRMGIIFLKSHNHWMIELPVDRFFSLKISDVRLSPWGSRTSVTLASCPSPSNPQRPQFSIDSSDFTMEDSACSLIVCCSIDGYCSDA
jgi:hypothetical protein